MGQRLDVEAEGWAKNVNTRPAADLAASIQGTAAATCAWTLTWADVIHIFVVDLLENGGLASTVEAQDEQPHFFRFACDASLSASAWSQHTAGTRHLESSTHAIVCVLS